MGCMWENLETFENHLPVKPKEEWDNIEQYVEYLRHFMAYRFA